MAAVGFVKVIAFIRSALSIIPRGMDKFVPRDPIESVIRIGFGLNDPEPGGPEFAGDDLPDVRLFNDFGEFLGMGTDPAFVEDGTFAEIRVPHTDSRQQATYALFSANNAVCIAMASVAFPDGTSFGWLGDWALRCEASWYYSDLRFPGASDSPLCMWIDGDGPHPHTGFQIHWPSWAPSLPPERRLSGKPAELTDDELCFSGPPFRLRTDPGPDALIIPPTGNQTPLRARDGEGNMTLPGTTDNSTLPVEGNTTLPVEGNTTLPVQVEANTTLPIEGNTTLPIEGNTTLPVEGNTNRTLTIEGNNTLPVEGNTTLPAEANTNTTLPTVGNTTLPIEPNINTTLPIEPNINTTLPAIDLTILTATTTTIKNKSKKRRTMTTEPWYETYLVADHDPKHTALKLCASPTSRGPDFANYAERLFCRMSDKRLFSFCGDGENTNIGNIGGICACDDRDGRGRGGTMGCDECLWCFSGELQRVVMITATAALGNGTAGDASGFDSKAGTESGTGIVSGGGGEEV